MGSLDPSDDELDDDDFRLRLRGDAATTEGGFINSSSSEQVEITVAPEQSGASSKRSPYSMVAGRTSAETSATANTLSSETRLLVEKDGAANMM